jgi:uncharacterized protein YjbI with pentapeptide repeats
MEALSASGQHRRLTQLDVDAICARHDRLWAAKPGGARAVFAWCDLSGLDLSRRNLADSDFTCAILNDCRLVGAKLDHAIFFCADLQNADLSETSLKRADLRGACLRGADLTAADMFEADLREGSVAAADPKMGYRLLEHGRRVSEAQGAILVGANLERSRLSGLVAMKADFTDAVLKDAKLVRANLKQCTLTGANLAGADMSGADCAGADLRDAILVGANTRACKFDDAQMEGALTDRNSGRDVGAMPYAEMLQDHALWCETQGAQGSPSEFNGADLRKLGSIKGYNLTALSAKGAVFYGVDMEGVQLQGAQLQGADLRGCNLKRADLRGARLGRAKLSGADLREALMGPLLIGEDRLLPCDLSRAAIKAADLRGADLRQAVLVDADLSRSDMTGAHVRQANFQGAITEGLKGLDLTAL